MRQNAPAKRNSPMALDCSFALTDNFVFVCPDPALRLWPNAQDPADPPPPRRWLAAQLPSSLALLPLLTHAAPFSHSPTSPPLRCLLPLPPSLVQAFDDVMDEFLAKHHTSVRRRTGQPVGTDRKGVPLVHVRTAPSVLDLCHPAPPPTPICSARSRTPRAPRHAQARACVAMRSCR